MPPAPILSFEHVLSEPARFAHLGPKPVDHPRDDGARDDAEAPHDGRVGREPRQGARIERAPRQSAAGHGHHRGGHHHHRGGEQGRDDDGAQGRGRDERGADGGSSSPCRSVAASRRSRRRHRPPGRSPATARWRTRPTGSGPNTALISELSSRPPPSIHRENRMDRSPLRHSHQKIPALAAETMVSTRSTPGRATAPIAPRPLASRMMKKMTFQKSATRACRKARPSSL